MSSPNSPVPHQGIELSALSNYLDRPGMLLGVGFWPRAFARIIDFAVHYSICAAAGFVFGIMLVVAGGGRIAPQVMLQLRKSTAVAFVLALLGSIAFEAICEAVHGSTPGKLALSLVVVQEDGSPCTPRAAIIRSFAYLIDGLFFGLVAYSSMDQTPQEQRFGDKWAETIVCRREDVSLQSRRGIGLFLLGLFFAAIVDAALAMLGLLSKLSS